MLASVIVPVRNRPDQIGPAMGSLLRQTTRDLEVIVVDDASTDSTVTVAKAIADLHTMRRSVAWAMTGP